ncbi:MAG: hypothetical protein QOE35_3543 [Actinomycetota bacterium]
MTFDDTVEFSPEEELLIAALGEGLTHQAAAAVAGVSTKTVQRRLRHGAFAAAVSAHRQERVSEVSGMLIGASVAAVATLSASLSSDLPGERLTAAKTILDLGRRFHREAVLEQELRTRLELLEAAANGETGHGA